jgi:hypothetical protein
MAASKENREKNYLLAVALSYFVGSLGVDRFYLGYIGTGVLKLVTLGGFGVWSFIDFILVALGKLKAKGDKRPLESYGKYAKTIKMVALIIAALQIVIIVAFGVYTIFLFKHASGTSADNRTFDKATYVADNLESYVVNQRSIPDSLDQVANNSDTTDLTYHKDSDSAYTFCVVYKHAGVAGDGSISDMYAPSAYADVQHLYITINHKAGPNCRTIRPVFPPDPVQTAAADASKSVVPASERAQIGCSVAGVSSNDRSTGKIGKLTRYTQMINGVATFTLTISSRGGGLIYNVPPEAKVLDGNCGVMNHGDVVAGDDVIVFRKIVANEGSRTVGDTMTAVLVVDQTRHQ